MINFIILTLIFNLINPINSYNYLNNSNNYYKLSQLNIDFWFDTPLYGYHNSYPPSGINCIINDKKYSYLLSSQSNIYRNNEFDKCNYQKRTVSIFKQNISNYKTEEHLIIGDKYTGSNTYKCYRWNEDDLNQFESLSGTPRYYKEKSICINKGFYWRYDFSTYPTDCYCSCCQKIISPVGGKGSDDIVSCGIDFKSNILYYIGANKNNCPNDYNTRPSIVRINLTNFSFIDRHILNELENFYLYGNWSNQNILDKNKYFNYPSSSKLINQELFITFNHLNSGIWKLNIIEFPLRIIDSFRQKIYFTRSELQGNQTVTVNDFYYMNYLTKILYNQQNNILYVISDTSTSNANILILNLTKQNYFNNTNVITLNGINIIKDIKIDENKNNIYILSGQLSSKLYKLNFNFDVISVSSTCNIDSLNFPVEWKNANSMILDDITGFIYLFFVNLPYTGYSIVRTNTMEYTQIHRLFFVRNNGQKIENWTPIYIETVNLNRKLGKIIIANKAHHDSFFMVYGTIDLLGCSEGKRIDNNLCLICPQGTFTSSIGSNYCELCNYGHSTLSDESKECFKCQKGMFANLLGSSSCKNCMKGQYSENEGSKLCTNCSKGKYSNIIKSSTPTNCYDCENGKYSLLGYEFCLRCLKGKYVFNKEKCVGCPKGKYSDIDNIISVNECKNCQKGRYNNNTSSNNSNYCLECDAGKYSLIIGGRNINVCKDCIGGKFKDYNSNKGVECEICPNGKYSILKSASCINCIPGKYNFGNSYIDHVSCLDCPVGRYNQNYGANNLNKCLKCPKGKYSNLLNSSSINNCFDCDKGKYNEFEGSSKINDCIDCPLGKHRKFTSGVSINDCIDCQVGYYSSLGSDNCKICPPGKITSLSGESECKTCEMGKYNKNNASNICNSCTDNSESTHDFKSCECIKGTYQTNKNPLICIQCPEYFICEKGSTIETLILEKRFWRANKTTLHIERCRKGYNCLGGIIINSSDDLCNKGHTGPMCDVCLDGWAKNEGKCFKCLTDSHVIARSYTFTIIFPFIISLIIYLMIKTANPKSSQSQKEPLSGVIKIFMNYSQIFTLASSFEINWPEIIHRLFDRTKEFSSPKISFYSSDCTIGWTYYQKLIAYITLPLFYVLIVTTILSIYFFYFYKKKRKEELENNNFSEEEKNKFTLKNPEPLLFYQTWMCTSLLIGLFLAWPTIIKQSLSIIPCKKFGNKYYLLQDLSIECYTNQYKVYLILCYLSLIIYGIIVPFIAFNLIRVKRFSLYDFESIYEMPAALSFLFLGYRQEVWYYEFIVMAKKYSLILITVFLKEYSRYQMISASLFVQASFFIHVFLRPYDSITNYGILCNKLESISLLALVVTLNSGLFFGTISDQYDLGSFEYVLIFLLFLMNALVIIYFLYYLIKLSFNEASEFIKKGIKKLNEKKSFLLNYISDDKKKFILKWSNKKKIDTHGINLKSDEEISLFEHFFKDKRMFSHSLKELLKDDKLKDLDYLLNRIRSKIEIIEKQRCWLLILNNRLYKKLRFELLKNKEKLDDSYISKLDDILENYIQNGLKYSQTINQISDKTLTTIKRKSIVNLELKNFNEIHFSSNSTYEESSCDESSDTSSENETKITI